MDKLVALNMNQGFWSFNATPLQLKNKPVLVKDVFDEAVHVLLNFNSQVHVFLGTYMIKWGIHTKHFLLLHITVDGHFKEKTWAIELQTEQATFLVEHHFALERMTDTQTYLG